MSVLRTVTENGDTVDWTLEVKHNNTMMDCSNTQVALTIPSGVSLTGPSAVGSTVINVPKGYYNLSDDTWYIGLLEASEIITVTLTFTVDDTSLKGTDNRFLVTATLTSSCTETNNTNNADTLAIEVVDPCTQISLSIGVDDTNTAAQTDLSIG